MTAQVLIDILKQLQPDVQVYIAYGRAVQAVLITDGGAYLSDDMNEELKDGKETHS